MGSLLWNSGNVFFFGKEEQWKCCSIGEVWTDLGQQNLVGRYLTTINGSRKQQRVPRFLHSGFLKFNSYMHYSNPTYML
jgi:hypothetical protein